MVFSSPAFLFMFLPIAIAIYYNPFCKSRIFRNRFLLFISLVFYACGEPIYILLLLFSILAGWRHVPSEAAPIRNFGRRY